MPDPIVVDLSHWNPTPDWNRLKAGGLVGVIHKATENVSYVDPMLFERAKAAMAAGLCWSTYHFLRPGSMQKQMAHYLNTINPVPGERVCLDHEDPGVSLDDLVEAVNLLVADPRKLQVTIYSGHVIKEQLGNDYVGVLASKTSLWIAQYASAPSWPKKTWPQWSLWQYTDKAQVDGISKPVDGNRWNGSEEGLRKWFGPATEIAPAPSPEPDLPTVDIVTTGRVRVTINGVEVVTP
jgi:lysozyme